MSTIFAAVEGISVEAASRNFGGAIPSCSTALRRQVPASAAVARSLRVDTLGASRVKSKPLKHKSPNKKPCWSKPSEVVPAEVETAVKKLIAAQTIVERYRQRIVPTAKDLFKRMQAAYAEGGSTLLEIIDAQQTWRIVRKEFVKVIADYLKALATLKRAVGGSILPSNVPSRSEKGRYQWTVVSWREKSRVILGWSERQRSRPTNALRLGLMETKGL